MLIPSTFGVVGRIFFVATLVPWSALCLIAGCRLILLGHPGNGLEWECPRSSRLRAPWGDTIRVSPRLDNRQQVESRWARPLAKGRVRRKFYESPRNRGAPREPQDRRRRTPCGGEIPLVTPNGEIRSIAWRLVTQLSIFMGPPQRAQTRLRCAASLADNVEHAP